MQIFKVIQPPKLRVLPKIEKKIKIDNASTIVSENDWLFGQC